MSAAQQITETFSIVVPLFPDGPEVVSDFTELFPLNPIKYGQMTAYEPASGLKSCTTRDAAPKPDDLENNLRLTGHQGRIGYLPGFTDTTDVGCVDIDLKHFPSAEAFEQVVGQVTAEMSKSGITWYRENSTNGGAHLWVFLEAALSYGRVRDFLKGIIKDAGQAQLETYPQGSKDVEGRWVFMPYAGALADDKNLGLTYLQDEQGKPIPFWQLSERIQRTPMSKVDAVLAQQTAATQQEPQQSKAGDLSPEGFAKLKEAVLHPPESFPRHDSIEAFLNVAEKMGKQAEMADFLKSEEVRGVWFSNGQDVRSPEQWAAEIDRWIDGSYGNRQYGIPFLKALQWDLPELPRVAEENMTGSRYGDRLEAFKVIERKYAPSTINAASGVAELQDFGFDNFDDVPVSEPLVENILIKRSLCGLIGKAGGGKSMIALDIAMHVALGIPWRGRKVEQGGVAWIAAEGIEETIDRIMAWVEHHGKKPAELSNFRVLNAPSKPMTDLQLGGGLEQMIQGLQRIEAKTGPLGLIVVDTVSRTYGVGMDENKNDDMVFYTNCAELLVRIFNCTVWLLHHEGRGNTNAARGASSFDAPMEAISAVRKVNGGFQLTTIKMRSGPGEPEPVKFSLVTQEIRRADKVRGVGVVTPSLSPDQLDFSPEMLPEQAKAVLTALIELHSELERPIKRKEWQERCKELGIDERRVNEHIRKLAKEKHIKEIVPAKSWEPVGDEED